MSDMTEEEWEAFVNDPLFRRLWEISEDVHSSRADPATVKAWDELRETMIRTVRAAERATARYEPEDREKVMRGWIEEFIAERWPRPTRH